MNIHLLLILVVLLFYMVIVNDTPLHASFLAPLFVVFFNDLLFLVRDAVALAGFGPDIRLELGANQLEQFVCFLVVTSEHLSINSNTW